jgi:uncharacterized protein (UPF0332 family)
MSIENRNDYINYRFQRALDSFEEAVIMADNKRWNAVVNRLYYACFYAVIALLLKNNIETQTHDGARTQFGLSFIKPGNVDKKFGKLFSKLFDYRQKGDYGDLYDFDEITVSPLIIQVKDFLNALKTLVKE